MWTGWRVKNMLSYSCLENVGSWHGAAALCRLLWWHHTRLGICSQLPEMKWNGVKGCIDISDLIFGKKKKIKTNPRTLGCRDFSEVSICMISCRICSAWQWQDSGSCHLWDEQTLCNTHLSTVHHVTHLMKALHINSHKFSCEKSPIKEETPPARLVWMVPGSGQQSDLPA